MRNRGLRRAATPVVVGGIALSTALGVGAVATTVPQVVASSSAVNLKALITHGSATNWNADGIDEFYGLDWNAKYGSPTVISQFSLFPYNVNPDNLTAALRNNVGDAEPDLVLTSGRGSGAASWTMIKLLNGSAADRRLVLDTRWILDNNVNRPNGGYGSRYIPFTLLGVYPLPTPIDSGADIVDVGYEYAWNSSAPAYVSNVVALLNSIIAYAYRYKSQAFTGLPTDPEYPDATDPVTGEPVLEKGYHYIVAVDGTVTKVPLKTAGTNTTFVTYRAEGLPMLQPLRDFGGDAGNTVADFLQPALKVIVDASYPDNDPVANPDKYITASIFTPPDVALKALGKLPAAVQKGFDNLKKDLGLTSPVLAQTPKAAAGQQVPDLSPKKWKSRLGVQDKLDRLADRVAKKLRPKGFWRTTSSAPGAGPGVKEAESTSRADAGTPRTEGGLS